MQELKGDQVVFKVPPGTRAPYYPFIDDTDGHEGAFLIPTGRIVGTSTVQPAIEQATVTRFVAAHSRVVTGGAVILDTGSSSSGDGEVAIYDGTGTQKLATTGAVDLGFDGTAGTVEFEFEEPVTLIAGDVYYLALSNPSGDAIFVAVGFSSNLVAEIYGADPPEVLSAVFGAADVRATLTTSLTGANNDLKFTAATAGEAGNDLGVEYVDPGDIDQALAVSVVSADTIHVLLATDGAGLITSTAAQIKTAVDAHAPAHALATVANAPANSGAGVVTATPGVLPFAGGDDNVAAYPIPADISDMSSFTNSILARLDFTV